MSFVRNDNIQLSLFDKGFSLSTRELEFLKKSHAYRSTEEFKKHSHFRNGVEAIPSLLRRKYYVDKIPIHGRLRTKLYFGFRLPQLTLRDSVNLSRIFIVMQILKN